MDHEADAEEVYVKYVDELLRLAAAVAGPSHADDLVSTVMARVLLDSAGRWRQIAQLDRYLVRAVVNEARSRHRSAARRLRRERDDHVVATASQDALVRVEVLDAVGRLTVRQRAVVYLTYWQDRSAGDVADELGLSLRTVERELHRARTNLEVLLR